jgi:transcriptional regulator with XRE-family HTH domain
MITGESLRILRQLKGNRTQKEISKKMNISQPAYCKWEKRKTVNEEDKRFERFLRAIDCSRSEFEKLRIFLTPPPINKMVALALAFLIASLSSLMSKRFTSSLSICVFSLGVHNVSNTVHFL